MSALKHLLWRRDAANSYIHIDDAVVRHDVVAKEETWARRTKDLWIYSVVCKR